MQLLTEKKLFHIIKITKLLLAICENFDTHITRQLIAM